MATIIKDLGVATAYGYAKSKGYTGTEEEFAELMASYATVAGQAAQSAEDAAGSASAAHDSEVAAEAAQDKAEDAQDAAEAAAALLSDCSAEATTLSAGSAATAAYANGVFSFGIPKGDTGYPTDAQVISGVGAWMEENPGATVDAVDAWLAAHPEATTTVQDGSITNAKLASDVKNALYFINSAKYVGNGSSVSGGTELEISKYINSSGGLESNSNYRCSALLAINGDLSINCFLYGTDFYKSIAFYDEDESFISGIGGESSSWTRISGEQTIPATAKYYRVCIMNADTGGYITCTDTRRFSTVELDTAMASVTAAIDALNDAVDNVQTVAELVEVTPTLGYMGKNGGTGADNTLAYTQKITVEKDDLLLFSNKYPNKTVSMRFVAAFNGNTAVESAGTNEGVATWYTVPAGITHVVITGYVGTSGVAASLPYLFKITKGTPEQLANTSAFHAAGNLGDGGQLELPIENIAKNKSVVFNASTITSFSSVTIGRTGYYNAVRVTETNIEVIDSENTVASQTAHGLTIANNISIRIYHDPTKSTDKRYVCVSSNGVDATPVEITWDAVCSGHIYAKSVGSVLTGCALSLAPFDIHKSVWCFGDSYCGVENDRWVGVLKNYGYLGNVLLNAFAGESAADELPAFLNLIKAARPKFALWACGMNDGGDVESASSPKNNWLNAVTVFLTTCKSLNITPILSTIPTVSTVNNEQKNAWVRESGYRYVDFAAAVGAQSNGTWFSGMLSTDGVHPSSVGAIALCNRALADFPELMQFS